MRVVLFSSGAGSPLYLDGATFDADCRVSSGWVINGEWHYEVDGETCKALHFKGGKVVVNSWPRDSGEYFVVVTSTVRGDYNRVIEWARKR